jgi:hypothetical protein
MENCEALKFVAFENDSKMRQIESSAFLLSGLNTVVIPASVEVMNNNCSSDCRAFVSIIFENESKLQGIGADVFSLSRLKSTFINAW